MKKEWQPLAKAPPDGKTAIRSTFGAAEGLFKLMFPNSPRLTASDAQSKLEPLLQRAYETDSVAKRAAMKTYWQFLEERQDGATLQLAADEHLAGGINAVDLED